MYKKTKVKNILEMLELKLSVRTISNSLQVSSKSVVSIIQKYKELNMTYEEILSKGDDEIYELFFP